MSKYEELRKKYIDKLRANLDEPARQLETRQYQEFRKEYLPKPLSRYERWCNRAARFLPISPDKKRRAQLEEHLAALHLQVTPEGAVAFSVFYPLLLVLLAGIAFVGLPVLLGNEPLLGVTMYVGIISLFLVIPLGRIPGLLADSWRMKASNQMVLCIFYIVTYMRHTSNLELAIDFAAEHLGAPLSLDMKKVIWNLETEKHGSVRDSLEEYLARWRGHNDEFIEAMHLVESSLVESAETRRLDALDKALTLMLDETYEKMLHYAHNLKGPLTTLHMLGIILPILGLVILPLMVAFMPAVRWYHLFLLYNVTLPVLVYFLGRDILSKRPTGYGSSNADDDARGKGSPGAAAFFVILVFGLIGFLPLLLHVANPTLDYVSGTDAERGCVLGFCKVDVTDKDQVEDARFWFLEYRDVPVNEAGDTVRVGPYGLVATLFSVFVVLAAGVGGGVYYRIKAGDAVRLRQAAKKLELEFASALFQMGNRLADGLPLEIAFSRVAETMPDSLSGRFFSQVSVNITNGLSVQDAIFHERYGALAQYPSNIIESSMKVLVESSRKGPLIASQAIINVSNYIKEMHRVDERLKDLMADVISSMKSQIKFLTPVIAGVVMGITSMITAILGKLSAKVGALGEQAATAGNAGLGANMLGALSGGAVPTYQFQVVVGLYVVQIVYILSVMVSGIENGADTVTERDELGRNLTHSTFTYAILTFLVVLLFNMVAVNIIPAGGP